MKAPLFWQKSPPTFLARALKPLSWLYASLSLQRQRSQKAFDPGIPVICVGNLVMGGAGKTPVTAAIATMLQELSSSKEPTFHILSRGYGRTSSQIQKVNPSLHTALDVGDEPLLLSQHAPVWVGPSRPDLARSALQKGASGLLLDDGFQNNTLKKSVSLLVVDGSKGFGNEAVFPAGPLREPLTKGLERADALVLMGDDQAGVCQRVGNCVPLFKARFQLDQAPLLSLEKKKQCLAFSGIAYPEKFFKMLTFHGIVLSKTFSFKDHHVYTQEEMKRLLEASKKAKAPLLTTEKDWWRLPSSWRDQVVKISGRAVFEDPENFINFIRKKCSIR